MSAPESTEDGAPHRTIELEVIDPSSAVGAPTADEPQTESDLTILQSYLAAIFAASEGPIPSSTAATTHGPDPLTLPAKRQTTLSRNATDFSEAFRLYFGSNITIFPYLVALGGLMGTLGTSVVALVLLYQSAAFQCNAKLTAVDLLTLRKRRNEPSSPGPEIPVLQVPVGDVARADVLETQAHLEVSSYPSLVVALWCHPPYKAPGVPFTEDSKTALFPYVVHGVMLLAQVVSACSFASLVAGNMEGFVKGVHCVWKGTCASEHPPDPQSHSSYLALGIAACALSISTLFYVPKTYSLYAATNNAGLLSAGLVMLYATVSHQAGGDSASSSAGTNDPVRLLARQTSDYFLLFPILVAYMTPAMFVTDVQTSIARRGFTFHRTAWTGFQAMTRFDRILKSAAVIAFLILFAFGSIVYFTFRERTNAVIALSLQPGANTQLLLALLLSVSTLACGTLNLGGIVETMDRVSRGVLWKALLLRVSLFTAIFVLLCTIPFFDLIASLSGSVGYNMFTFFFPSMLLLQSKLRAWEIKEQAPFPHSLLSLWMWHTSVQEKVFTVLLVVCGTVLLTTGVGTILIEVSRR